MELAQTVARWRQAAGLTKAALAQRIGCDPSLISRWEDGTYKPDEPWLLRIAHACNAPHGEAFGLIFHGLVKKFLPDADAA